MTSVEAQIQWNEDGVPVSTRFDDPYFSKVDGLSETRHVFVAGNDLDARLVDGFQIAELGFGTGLNFLATLQLWRRRKAAGVFRFTSFEAYPMTTGDMARALAAFPDLTDLVAEFLTAWRGVDRVCHLPGAELLVVRGDARESVAAWDGVADAWFLDGFSPARNPEMWEAKLLTEVANHTRPGGTLATYSAAGHVRRTLQEVGFSVSRTPGYGTKRHMTQAVRRDHV